MDAAAFRRLQHRMESRGRSASGCKRGNICSCSPKPPGDRGHNPASLFPLGASLQSWLLQRVEGVEVDVTSGGTDHRRSIPCCCSCCHGFHHLLHPPRAPADSTMAAEPCARRSSPPRAAAGAQGGRSVNTPADESPPPNPRDEVVREAFSEASMQATARRDIPFRPARASLMLSSFFRHEGMAPSSPKSPHVGEMSNGAENNSGRTQPMLQPTHYGTTLGSHVSQQHAPLMFTGTLGPAPPSHIQQQHYHQAPPGIPLESGVQSLAVQSHTDAERVQQQAAAFLVRGATYQRPPIISDSAIPTTTTAVSSVHTALAKQETATQTPIGPVDMPSDITLKNPPAVDGDPFRVPVHGTTTQPIDERSTALRIEEPSVSTTNRQMQPPQVSAPEGKTALAATTPAEEPTSTDVINALREKLLLEKADAYVRGLDQQKLEEEQLYREAEEELLRSQKHAEIVMLLTRLRHDDHEMLEALYEVVTQPEEAKLPVAAQAGEVKQYSPSSPLPPPPLPLPPAIRTTATLPMNSPRFPLGVMAAYEMNGEKQTEPKSNLPKEASVVLSGMLPSNPTAPHPSLNVVSATATIPSAPKPSEEAIPCTMDGTMQAWVDKYFGSTLDPQHRTLLQHVLLSREAELQRVAVAESQCRELEAELAAAKESGYVNAVGAAIPGPPSQQKQGRESELSRALALLRAKEEELVAVRKVQNEQEKKLVELKQALQPPCVEDSGDCRDSKVDDELRLRKLRCAATAEQEEFSAHRLAGLQAYIDRLRTEAQQTVVNIASSSAPPQSQPLPPVDTTTVRLSSLSGSRPSCCIETATPHSSMSFASPTSGQYHVFSSPTAGSTSAPVPQQQDLSGRLKDTPRPSSNWITPSVSDAARAAALQQLREDIDMECGRFVNEAQRWQQYLKGQEERWAQLHPR